MAAQQPAKTQPDWQVINLGESLGLNLSDDSETAQDENLVQASNTVARANCIETDNGLASFGTVSVFGTPRKVASVIESGGNLFSFLFTNRVVYKLIASVWTPLPDLATPVSTTVSVNALSTDSLVHVVSNAGFVSGKAIRILLDSGQYFVTQVSSLAAGVINFTPALPSASSVGKEVKQLYTFAGDNTYPMHWVFAPFSDHIIFTNCVDLVQTLDVNLLTIVDTPDLPFGTKCLNVALYDNSIFLINTTESSTREPRRIRWSAAGDDTDWSSVNDAGYKDLFDSSDALLAAAAVGPYLAVYRTNSITRFEPTGDATNRFDSPTVVTGVGIISSDALINVTGGSQLFVGRNNVHRYDGGFSVENIGDQVTRRLFGRYGTLDLTKAGSVYCLQDRDDKKVMLAYPTSASSDGFANKCLIYCFEKGKWTERIFAGNIAGGGELIQANTYSTLMGSESANKRISILCTSTGNLTWEYSNNSTVEIGGTAIPVIIETKDFGLIDMKCELDRATLSVLTTTAELFYSIDRGNNYVSMGTMSGVSTTPAHIRLPKQITFNTIRFKIVVSGYIKLISFAFRMKVSAEF